MKILHSLLWNTRSQSWENSTSSRIHQTVKILQLQHVQCQLQRRTKCPNTGIRRFSLLKCLTWLGGVNRRKNSHTLTS
jgi:hypothetical protein